MTLQYFSIFLANSPCSMLLPLWYCFLSRSFIMAHTAAVPFLHFSIMLERLRATRLANSYEREGHNFGWLALAISACFFVIYNLLVCYGVHGGSFLWFPFSMC
jgi:hypothetical protein